MDRKDKHKEVKNKQDFKTFIEWVKENGGKFPNIHFKQYGKSERGVHSKSKQRSGLNLIKIPVSLIIHDGMAKNVKYGAQLLEYGAHKLKSYKIILVTLYILATIKKDEFYEPYYNIFPNNLDNFPIFWNSRDLSALKGSNMLQLICDRKKQVVDDYNELSKICKGFNREHSFNDFMWVRTLVGSRNFGISIDGTHRVAMIPLADMLNHDPNPKVRWGFDDNDKMFKMQSKNDIIRGEAITDSYGTKCNKQYLMFYGFSLLNNTGNTFKVEIAHKNDANKELKTKIFSTLSGNLTKDIDSIFFNDMMTFIRIAVAKRKVLTAHTYRSYYSNPISIENELDALYVLKNYINTMLTKYSKGLEESKVALAKISKLNNKRNALVLIIGEMEILYHYKKMVNEAIDYLENKTVHLSPEFVRYFRKIKALKETEDHS